MVRGSAPVTCEPLAARDEGESLSRKTEKRLLFLCTGNYYRSRFAEELWRHLEQQEPSGWRAESRGLLVPDAFIHVAAISPHALHGLGVRGIRPPEPVRAPRQVESDDFVASARIVAMSESEHRSMVRRLFPKWVDAIEYWDVEDIDYCPAEAALDNLTGRVHALRLGLLGE
jgi:low molecular weight protein-tyrosine phosphatase